MMYRMYRINVILSIRYDCNESYDRSKCLLFHKHCKKCNLYSVCHFKDIYLYHFSEPCIDIIGYEFWLYIIVFV